MNDKKYTNLDAIIEMATGDEPWNWIPNYLSCPYVINPECEYDGGRNETCCTKCKEEWLEKEWKG